MADPLVAEGTVRARRAGASVAGYVLDVRLRADVPVGADHLFVPLPGPARLSDDGSFRMVLDAPGSPVGPAELTVSSPTGAEVHRQQFSLDELARPIALRVAT